MAKDVPPDDVLPILYRYLAFYIRTADKLQRTARWIENLPGGIKYLQEVVLQDKLGICKDLEAQMEELVGTYFCEWTETLKDPEKLKVFQQFANTKETQANIERVDDRDQQRPAHWLPNSATNDFKDHKWTSLTWQPLAEVDQFTDAASGSSITVKRGDTQLAIFKVKGKYYASQQMCPHRRAFVLSDGLLGEDDKTGKLWISCPLHKRNYELKGENPGSCSNDESVNVATFEVEAREDGQVYVKLPPVEELDGLLGTEKWKIRKEDDVKPLASFDKKYKARKTVSRADGILGEKARPQAIVAGGERGSGGIDW